MAKGKQVASRPRKNASKASPRAGNTATREGRAGATAGSHGMKRVRFMSGTFEEFYKKAR